MAFWASAGAATCQSRRIEQTPGLAKPVTIVLHASGDFASLVRLRIRASITAAASCLKAAEDEEHTEATAQLAGVAVGRLHQLMSQLESKSVETRKSAVIQLQSAETLQVLCQKAVVAKVYKSLMPHQSAVGFHLGDVKSCISLTPLGLWELHEALQAAVIKALTGSSSGVSAEFEHTNSIARWTSLSSNKLLSCDMLAAAPGVVQTALFVDLEVKAQPPSKMLLLVRAAGSIKFRLFCPMQALTADAKSLRAPLQPSDTTESLLDDPAKLAAAARQLDGRAVKLLPDEKLAFIKSLRPAPTDTAALEELSNFYLGHYGLRLPSKGYPFLVGVASHPEAESASLEVPSCCVMTNLGLAVLPGSSPGGSSYREAVKGLLDGLMNSELQLFGAAGFAVETRSQDASGVSALADAQVQFSQAASQAAPTAAAEGNMDGYSAVIQPKTYSIAAKWATALDVSKLEAAAKAEAAAVAGNHSQQKQPKGAGRPPVATAVTTAAAAQLMGLAECSSQTAAADTCVQVEVSAAVAATAQQKPVLQSHRRPDRLDPSRWSGLNKFLAERAKQQDTAGATAAAAGGLGIPQSARSRAPVASSSKAAVIGVKPGVIGAKSRKEGMMGAATKKQQPLHSECADSIGTADQAGIAGSANTSAAGGNAGAAAAVPSVQLQASVQAPVLKKAPAIGNKRAAPAAAAKPPAGKKAKTAAAGADGSSAASKPKTKRAAAAATAAADTGNAAAALSQATGTEPKDAAVSAASSAISNAAAAATCDAPAAAAAPKRAKTKASDLDIDAVTAKVLAAYAAGAGSSLKGLSVAEMQCYLRANGQKGGPTKKAEVEARLLAFLGSKIGSAG